MAKKEYDVCVVGGCGHVGLPLALALANAGKKVVAYDINRAVVEKVGRGQVPFFEKGMDLILPQVLEKTFFVSDDMSVVDRSEIIIITVGTPVDEHINPRYTPIMKFVSEIEPVLSPGHTMIMRSTVFPGTMEYIRNFFEDKGKKISLCFCPERIAEGRAMEELNSLPQIVSGFDAEGLKKCSDLFRCLTKTIIELTPLEAELAKLFNNVWRYIKFAISNQLYMIAQDSGADFAKVSHAMRHEYPRAQDFPKPGFAAGPCLFKDTMQLAAFYQHKFFLGHSAMLINEGMPDYIRDQLKKSGPLRRKKVGILGMAFKGETDDIRESLSFKLKKLLNFEGATVLCADEYWKDESLVSTEELIRESEVVVIGCPHEAYKKIDFRGKPVIDMWEISGGGS